MKGLNPCVSYLTAWILTTEVLEKAFTFGAEISERSYGPAGYDSETAERNQPGSFTQREQLRHWRLGK